VDAAYLLTESPEDNQILLGPLELRLDDREALVNGTRAALTVREFEVLVAMAARPDRVITREDVYGRVWGGRMPHRDRAVDVHVKRIRSKLASVAPDWAFVHTHFGIGYRLAPESIQPEAAS
jgi:DNA-binding response OmpR family regulator